MYLLKRTGLGCIYCSRHLKNALAISAREPPEQKSVVGRGQYEAKSCNRHTNSIQGRPDRPWMYLLKCTRAPKTALAISAREPAEQKSVVGVSQCEAGTCNHRTDSIQGRLDRPWMYLLKRTLDITSREKSTADNYLDLCKSQ